MLTTVLIMKHDAMELWVHICSLGEGSLQFTLYFWACYSLLLVSGPYTPFCRVYIAFRYTCMNRLDELNL